MGLLRSSVVLLAAVARVHAEGISEWCDAECNAAFRWAHGEEYSSWVSPDITVDPFYDNPANISEYAAGDIVRWEDLSGQDAALIWSIPDGMSLSRFLYMTEDVDGTPIPASAFFLLPYSNPHDPDKPFRTVVWTHGTAGETRQCAPSNSKYLYYEWAGPFTLARQGFAVIAPDYAGQGSDIPQGFMYEAGAMHANDAVFSLQAARQAYGDTITREWVVVGHSEGGQTAWRTNERQARKGKDVGGFLGAVALAPALRPLELFPELFRRADGGPAMDFNSIYVLRSIARLYPDLRIEDYLSDLVLNRLALADQGCAATAASLFQSLTPDELYKDASWVTHPLVLDWDARYNNPGPHPLAAPMLVVQGAGDPLVFPELTEADFDATCEKNPKSRADLVFYEKLDHNVAATQADYAKWINDRFENKTVPTGCRKTTLSPATTRIAQAHAAS